MDSLRRSTSRTLELSIGIERQVHLAGGSARGLLSLLLQHQSRPAFEGALL